MKTYYARVDGELVEYNYTEIVIRCSECKQFMTREKYSCGHDCEV